MCKIIQKKLHTHLVRRNLKFSDIFHTGRPKSITKITVVPLQDAVPNKCIVLLVRDRNDALYAIPSIYCLIPSIYCLISGGATNNIYEPNIRAVILLVGHQEGHLACKTG